MWSSDRVLVPLDFKTCPLNDYAVSHPQSSFIESWYLFIIDSVGYFSEILQNPCLDPFKANPNPENRKLL